MQLDFLLAAISIVIILGLAFYAGLLISRIKIQTKLNNKKIELQKTKQQQRNESISESIRVIALATSQDQCNVSEAAIRLTVLLETLSLKDPIDIDTTYPALSALFQKIKDMPTHEERKKVPVKALKKLDIQRQVFEAEHQDEIIKESLLLAKFSI